MPPTQDGSKRPGVGSWATFQKQRPSEALLRQWYSNGRTGLGWVTGAVSKNLEVLDFDDRGTFQEFRRVAADAGLGALVDRLCLGYLEYTPNGAHIAYRCSQIAGNTKLAQRAADRKALIETRGEGGFIIVAPSHGGVNPKGAYELQSGGVGSIQTITPEERQALWDLARVFDEVPPQAQAQAKPTGANGSRPGDDFCSRATWEDILTPHGWRRVSSRHGADLWCRPGKAHGISATTNHEGSGLLYVFSTSTAFDSLRGYNKFSAYALLNHGGDYGAAAKTLAAQGYGADAPAEDYSQLTVGAALVKPATRPEIPADLRDLLRVPGMVGELAAWINGRSNRPQPVLALAGALAGIAAIIGRKVRSRSNLRPNIYVIGVGGTGCGKEAARLALRDIYREIGQSQMVGESFASDASIESALLDHPSSLYLIDEIGLFFGMVRNTQHMAPHIAGIMPMFLKLYGASESTYRRRTYADRESNKDSESTIEQPALSIYGTSVPSNWYGALSRDYLANGLISRLLVFDAHDPLPKRQVPTDEDRAVPDTLRQWFRDWHAQEVNPDASGNLESLTPKPMIAAETAAASAIFADLDAEMDKRVLDGGCGDEVVPYTRVWTTAVKLALIRACGVCGCEQVEITANDAEWGAKLAIRQTDAFVRALLGSVSDDKDEADQQRIRAIISQHGGWVGRETITRATRFKKKRTTEALEVLIEAGDVEHMVGQTKGRPKDLFRILPK